MHQVSPVALLPELERWDSKALTSLLGLAPCSRDRGRKRGQQAIRGGRGIVRKALFLCACSLIQVESEFRGFYQNLRQGGKPDNVALVQVTRKLLLQLNALARRRTPCVRSTMTDNSYGQPAKGSMSSHGYCSGSAELSSGDLRWTTASADQDSTGLPRSKPLQFSDDSKPKSSYRVHELVVGLADTGVAAGDCNKGHSRGRSNGRRGSKTPVC